MNKVENLKKITLEIRAGTSPDDMNLTPQIPQFSFIFGLAPEGMTPFEYKLVDKFKNDEVLLHLKEASLATFFEHLNPPIRDLMKGRQEFYLQVKIAEISSPDNREVVKAMAEMAGHGGGCDCGCGCG
jgi:hypothetical protein